MLSNVTAKVWDVDLMRDVLEVVFQPLPSSLSFSSLWIGFIIEFNCLGHIVEWKLLAQCLLFVVIIPVGIPVSSAVSSYSMSSIVSLSTNSHSRFGTIVAEIALFETLNDNFDAWLTKIFTMFAGLIILKLMYRNRYRILARTSLVCRKQSNEEKNNLVACY